MGRNRCITIERQYGSGGREVARILSERLEIPCYGRELLAVTAADNGISIEELKKLDEKRTAVRTFTTFSTSYTNIFPSPMLPVYRAFLAVSMTSSTGILLTTTSSFTFGRRAASSTRGASMLSMVSQIKDGFP